MNYKLLLFWLFLLSYTLSWGQIENDSSIFWSTKRSLHFNDFQGKIPKNTLSSAGTAAEMNVNGFYEDGLPNFIVTCRFVKKASWVKDTMSIDLLIHEQLHFDIAELFSRKIRKGVLDLRNKHEANIDEYDKMIKSFLDGRTKLDECYDKETEHGIYKNRQNEWNEEVQKKLNELKTYEVDYSKYIEE